MLHSLILQLRTDNSELSTSLSGGEGGIRTHGPIAGTHAFQACRFDHSRTSPHRFSRGGILTRDLMTGKVITSAHYHGTAPRLPFLYYKEIKRRRGDEDSYRAGHPGRPFGDSHHTLRFCILSIF